MVAGTEFRLGRCRFVRLVGAGYGANLGRSTLWLTNLHLSGDSTVLVATLRCSAVAGCSALAAACVAFAVGRSGLCRSACILIWACTAI